LQNVLSDVRAQNAKLNKRNNPVPRTAPAQNARLNKKKKAALEGAHAQNIKIHNISPIPQSQDPSLQETILVTAHVQSARLKGKTNSPAALLQKKPQFKVL